MAALQAERAEVAAALLDVQMPAWTGRPRWHLHALDPNLPSVFLSGNTGRYSAAEGSRSFALARWLNWGGPSNGLSRLVVDTDDQSIALADPRFPLNSSPHGRRVLLEQTGERTTPARTTFVVGGSEIGPGSPAAGRLRAGLA